MPFELRALTADRLKDYFAAIERSFGWELHDDDLERWATVFEPERARVAVEGERIVGGGAAHSFRMTVPGGEVGAAGVTGVGVLPSHRRQGMLRELMAWLLDDAASRAEAVAILYASEGAIYQRFGYGMAAQSGRIEIDKAHTAFVEPVERRGHVRLLSADEAATALPPVYERLRPSVPGMTSRTDAWWRNDVLPDPGNRRRGGGPKEFAVLELDGELLAYAIYRVRSEWDERGSKGRLEVYETVALTTEATRALWRFLFDVDLVTTIRADLLPPDHPLPLLIAEPRRLGYVLGDGMWLRIVDVGRALAARTYGGPGSLVLEVGDRDRPANAGRWRLEIAPDGRASVERTGAPGHLRLGIAALASAYLGGVGLARLALAGRVEELVPGCLDRADALFRSPRAPWNAQIL